VGVVVACSLGAFSLAVAQPGSARIHHRHHHRHHRTHRTGASRPGSLRTRVLVPQQCPGADASVTSAPVASMRAAVLCLTNQERSAYGLPGLRASTRLNSLAQGWTQTMVATGTFAHPVNFAGRFTAIGYDWQAIGENIATGFTTPTSVVRAWMASAKHCRNMLDPHFRDVGVGELSASVNNAATLPGTWTVDFGLLMSQPAPSGNARPQSGCPY
jgi:uncharacterized protein YkwD